MHTLSIDVGTAAQWRSAGLTTPQFRSLVRAGSLVPQRRGVYVRRELLRKAADSPTLRHALRVAAVTTAQSARGAVASHQSAAMIHGLDLLSEPPADVVWLTRPPGTYRGRSADGVRFHSAGLPREHVTRLGGVTVTTATRTVVDLGRSLSFMEGVVVADSALRLGKTTDLGLNQVLRACAGWPGIEAARRAAAFSTESAESVLESCARVCFAQQGLPQPRLQVNILNADGGFIARADFYWDDYRTIAEADGMAKYDDPQRAVSQLRRDMRLREAGYKVVHFTWAELFAETGRVIARIRAALAAPAAY